MRQFYPYNKLHKVGSEEELYEVSFTTITCIEVAAAISISEKEK